MRRSLRRRRAARPAGQRQWIVGRHAPARRQSHRRGPDRRGESAGQAEAEAIEEAAAADTARQARAGRSRWSPIPTPSGCAPACRAGRRARSARPPPAVAAVPADSRRASPACRRQAVRSRGIMLGDLQLAAHIEEDVGYSPPIHCCFRDRPRVRPMRRRRAASTFSRIGRAMICTGSLTGGYTDYFARPRPTTRTPAARSAAAMTPRTTSRSMAKAASIIATQTPGSVTCQPALRLVARTGARLSRHSARDWRRPEIRQSGAFAARDARSHRLSGRHASRRHDRGLSRATIYNDWGLRARAAYQISPVISPFVEWVFDTRHYDQRRRFHRLSRAIRTARWRAPARRWRLSGQLTGEASLGYGERHYRDPRLPDLRAPLIDASLIWSATPLTTVTLKTSTNLVRHDQRRQIPAPSRAATRSTCRTQLLRNLTLGAERRLRHRRLRGRAACMIRR